MSAQITQKATSSILQVSKPIVSHLPGAAQKSDFDEATSHLSHQVESSDSHSEKKFRTQAKALEVVYKGHISGTNILSQIRGFTYGLYKGFVKWHTGVTDDDEGSEDSENLEGPHTHVGLILREKPDLKDAYNYFTLKVEGSEGIRPTLVSPLGKGNAKPLKKLSNYVAYLCDGHDNGTYDDTWNYKYDHELVSCKSVVAKALCLMSRGATFEEMYKSGSWDLRADLAANKKKILSAWRETKRILYKSEPCKLRPWQAECIHKLDKQNDREVMWIVDPDGNHGKTFLCKEMALHHDAAVFGNAGKKDLAFAYDDQPIVAFNLTRTTTERVNYEAMEALKDGLLFSAKYESETKVFTPPKMVVMSNNYPNYDSMSLDRWCVYELKGGALIKSPSPSPQEDFSRSSGTTSSLW